MDTSKLAVGQEVAVTGRYDDKYDFGYKVKRVTPKTGTIVVEQTYSDGTTREVRFTANCREKSSDGYSRSRWLQPDLELAKATNARVDARHKAANLLNGIAAGLDVVGPRWAAESMERRTAELQARLDAAAEAVFALRIAEQNERALLAGRQS